MALIAGFGRTLILGIGLLAATTSQGRCDDSIDTNRDSVVQGVRDDVRRQIKEREAASAEARSTPQEVVRPRRKIKKRQTINQPTIN